MQSGLPNEALLFTYGNSLHALLFYTIFGCSVPYINEINWLH